ncbi:hypothetical protein SESBI_12030 [Sesbania bispinosa]|nr:hypothetical protein SESBI_12030 [Sesbania bispinosa]
MDKTSLCSMIMERKVHLVDVILSLLLSKRDYSSYCYSSEGGEAWNTMVVAHENSNSKKNDVNFNDKSNNERVGLKMGLTGRKSCGGK